MKIAKSKCKLPKSHLMDKQKKRDDYKGETLKIIRGQSKMSIDLLNALVEKTEEQIKEAHASADTAEAELQELLETSEGLKREYDQLLSWAYLYDKSSFEAKEMIVSQFISSVRVAEITILK
ncbi:MAG: hypothetical protein VB078_00675 [Clostridiaceae bacterium]|nr:hypothetical protein [Clostridiaceae bacterium]